MQIEVDTHDEEGPIVHTFAKDEIIVGRGKDCDLRIVAEGVSRKHARIYKKDAMVFIEDLNSSNGTFINEKRIQKQELTSFFPAFLGAGVSISLKDV